MKHVPGWRHSCISVIAWARVYGVVLVCAAICMPARAANAGVTVRQIRSLTPSQAAEQRQVTVRGTVITLSGWKDSFFLQDGTAGISVDRLSPLPEVHAGDRIVLTGVTGPGSFAPVLVARHIHILGSSKRPPARVVRANEISYGSQDSQWLALRGVIRAAEVRSIWGRDVLTASLDIGDGVLVSVRVHDFQVADAARLNGARVTVPGVCGTVFNDKRQFLGTRLFVASTKDFHLDERAPANPFREAPFRRIADFLQFNESSSPAGLIRTTGVVTWQKVKRGFFLQDGTQGIFVRSKQGTVAVGTTVDVAGSTVLENGAPVLQAVSVRTSDVPKAVQPVLVSAAGLLTEHDGFVSAPYASVLVRVEGKLLESIASANDDTLLLQAGTAIFSARIPRQGVSRHWEVGSQLLLTGVCKVEGDDAHEPASIELEVGAPGDVRVIRGAPWWTAAHAVWIVSMLLFVIVAMLGWIGFLRWQTMLKTQATTDPLTGIYNRRSFLLLAQKQRELAQHMSKGFHLIFVDVDHFKEVNDQFGHREGDNILRAIAAMLQQVFRKTDVVGRLGGDEFAIATAGASSAPIRRRLEQALHSINQTGAHLCPISLSMGVLECDEAMWTAPMEELLERADLLMYEQKRAAKARQSTVHQALAAAV